MDLALAFLSSLEPTPSLQPVTKPPTCTEIRFCSNYHPAITKESVPKAQLLESRGFVIDSCKTFQQKHIRMGDNDKRWQENMMGSSPK
jgi:hypothetical protein